MPELPLEIHADPRAAARALAREIALLVRAKPDCVLGLATGRTPVPLYDELARLVREEGLSLVRVRCFNLDEYLDLAPGDPRSFRAWIEAQLVRRTDLRPENVNLPRGGLAPEAAEREAERYAQSIVAAGGIDLQIAGIGRNGHIGFNEPGSGRDSRARVVELAQSTRADAAAAFGGLEHVPRRAITLGLSEILAARAIRVLAFGAGKAAIVARLLREQPSAELPASLVRGHPAARLVLDREAAGALPAPQAGASDAGRRS